MKLRSCLSVNIVYSMFGFSVITIRKGVNLIPEVDYHHNNNTDSYYTNLDLAKYDPSINPSNDYNHS